MHATKLLRSARLVPVRTVVEAPIATILPMTGHSAAARRAIAIAATIVAPVDYSVALRTMMARRTFARMGK